MSDGYNPLEPVADAVLVAASLFLELGIKSICNLTILTSKTIGQIANYLFEDKPKYESFNYEIINIFQQPSTLGRKLPYCPNRFASFSTCFIRLQFAHKWL